METRRVVGIQLSPKEAEIIKKAFLLSPFRNEREFFRVIGKCLVDSVKEVINNGNGTIHRNSTISVISSDKKNNEESTYNYLNVPYDIGKIKRSQTVLKYVPIYADEVTWNFLKNQVKLNWLVKFCVIVAANYLLRKYSKKKKKLKNVRNEK
ncbi:MAG: hypothetical protein ACP5KK_03265 [Candidatus Nanoarchaeia archaeon]